MSDKVIRLERGWAGHFIYANRCRFRRNTLLTYGETMIVVSSVGLMEGKVDNTFDAIGWNNRYYETMAFHADKTNTRYFDIDASRQVFFTEAWAIDEIDADDRANTMHEMVVNEITRRLEAGDKFEVEP